LQKLMKNMQLRWASLFGIPLTRRYLHKIARYLANEEC